MIYYESGYLELELYGAQKLKLQKIRIQILQIFLRKYHGVEMLYSTSV
jgi:hypothetical protein